MSQQSIDGRLQRLENEFQKRGRVVPGERAPESPSLSLGAPSSRPGSGRRPRPPAIFPGGVGGGFPPQQQPTAPSETDMRMREVYKASGKLNVDGVEYRSQVSDLLQRGELGSGSCGHVVEMLHKPSGAIIAVKQMRRSGNQEETKRILMDLYVVVRSHDCPYIVRCLGCFVTEADVWICMELMASCFDKLLKRLAAPIPEAILGKVTVATVNALSYLKEEHGVIHRDVKPSNILLDRRGNIKLCDFGISGRLVDSKAKTRSSGCPAYMAPERIDPPDPTRPDYDIRADVWSLGISLVELATGVFPYRDCQNDFEVLTRVIEEDPPTLPSNGVFSPEFKSFVQQCLTKDYRDRPKYAKLLKHPFVVRSARSQVSVGEWYAGLSRAHTPTPNPPTAPPPPPAPATISPHSSGSTASLEYPLDAPPRSAPDAPPRSAPDAPPRSAPYPPSQFSPPQFSPPQPPTIPHISSPQLHANTNGFRLGAPCRGASPRPGAGALASPQTPPPPSAPSPRPFERAAAAAAPAWLARHDDHATPTPSRAWWATAGRLPGGSSSQPASLEAELGSYSPCPRRRTLERCASPPPPPPPARRVSADSRWRPSPAGSGNTSPLVLQRFYHQSQQRRSRADLHATPRHRSLSREHSTGRSPEPPPRSSRNMLNLDANGSGGGGGGGGGETEHEPPGLHERLQLHDRLSEGRSLSLTRAELRNGWRAEHAAAAAAAAPPPHAPSKHHYDDQGSQQQPLQPTRQLSRAPRWGGAESWSVPASPLPPRAPPPRPAD